MTTDWHVFTWPFATISTSCVKPHTCTMLCIHHAVGECELIDHNFKDGRVSPFSLPRCRNVYVLPGVPDLLRQKWRTLKVPSFCRVWGPSSCMLSSCAVACLAVATETLQPCAVNTCTVHCCPQDHLMRGGNTSTPWQSIVLRLSLSDETAITPTLQQLNSSMHNMLSVGSYPVTGQVTMGVLHLALL